MIDPLQRALLWLLSQGDSMRWSTEELCVISLAPIEHAAPILRHLAGLDVIAAEGTLWKPGAKAANYCRLLRDQAAHLKGTDPRYKKAQAARDAIRSRAWAIDRVSAKV